MFYFLFGFVQAVNNSALVKDARLRRVDVFASRFSTALIKQTPGKTHRIIMHIPKGEHNAAAKTIVTAAAIFFNNQAGGQKIIAAVPAEAGFDAMAPLALHLPPRHLHLFDPETGRQLAERMLAVADGRPIALPAIRDTDREVRPKAEYA